MKSVRMSITIALIALLVLGVAMVGGFTERAEAALPAGFQLGVGLEYLNQLSTFEANAGHKADIFLWYQSIGESLDTATLGPIAQAGRTIQLAWEPWWFGAADLVNQPDYQLRDITAGNWDADIHRWAREMRNFGYPIIIRPMGEMNGNWTSWSGTVNGNQPSDYIPAWRHIHDIFVAEGAGNVKFDWSPNRDWDVTSATNTFNTYYPGDAYVDYIGIDGYNWGTIYKTPDWTSTWQSFEEIFKYSYDVAAAKTSKPIIISEGASTELGGNKAQWITTAFNALPTRFPRVVSWTWFNYNKETDWRIESSAASLTAFKAAVSGGDTSPSPPPASDTVKPSVNISSPAASGILYRRAYSRVAASDNVGVTKVELYLGGRLVASDTAAPYEFYFNTRSWPVGPSTLTAKAYDAAGNQSAVSIPVTVQRR